MKVTIGKEGCKKTHQSDFPERVQCNHCGCTAQIAFVAHEGLDGNDERYDTEYVCDLGKEDPYSKGRMWLHDRASFATYICTDCLKATTILNQA